MGAGAVASRDVWEERIPSHRPWKAVRARSEIVVSSLGIWAPGGAVDWFSGCREERERGVVLRAPPTAVAERLPCEECRWHYQCRDIPKRPR